MKIISINVLFALYVCNAQMMHNGIYKIEAIHEMVKESTSFYQLQVIVFETHQDTMEAYIGSRNLWQSYCFSGGPLDHNTGCQDSTSSMNPDQQELEKWKETNSCYCDEDQFDKYGEDSEICDRKELTNLKPFKAKEIKQNRENGHFWRHTCNKSCGCKLRKRRIPIRLEVVQGDENVYEGLLLPNGEVKELKIGINFLEMEDGNYLINRTEKLIPKVKTADCFYTKEGEAECYFKGGHTIYFKPNKRVTCSLHICIKIYDGTMLKPYTSPSTRREKSLSIESAFEMIDELDFDRELLKYDIVKLLNEIEWTRGVLKELITSVMMVDNKLLGKILKREIETEVIERNAFKIGLNKANKGEGECYLPIGERYLSVPKINGSCNGTIEPIVIKLGEQRDLKLPVMSNIEISETSYDIDLWKEQKKEIDELLKFLKTEGYHYTDSGLKDLLNAPSGYLNGIIHMQWVIYGLMAIGGYFILMIVIKLKKLIL